MHRVLACSIAAIALAASPPARPAESYDNCTGFVDSLPATIATQGTWCLRKDLSTAQASGSAITIAANNVTLDCNDFKLGGLPAGPSSLANGVFATGRQNATVRNCGIRGFLRGIYLFEGSGHQVEDNRLDGNLLRGLVLRQVDDATIRRNRVLATGGHPASLDPVAIECNVHQGGCDILDNVVNGVRGDPGYTGDAYGILLSGGTGSRIAGNAVLDPRATGTGTTGHGIHASDVARSFVEGNRLLLRVARAGSTAVSCTAGGVSLRRNDAWGFEGGYAGCLDDGGNSVRILP